MNLGSPINSNDDDFAIALQSEKGLGYVISNRGKAKDAYRQLVFSYYDTNKKSLHDIEEYKFLEVMNTNLAAKYSNTIFED